MVTQPLPGAASPALDNPFVREEIFEDCKRQCPSSKRPMPWQCSGEERNSHSRTHGHLRQSNWDRLPTQDSWNEAQYIACSWGRADCGCSISRLPPNPGTDWTNLGEKCQWAPNALMFPQRGVCLLCSNLPSSERHLLLSKGCRTRHEKWHHCFSVENSTQHLHSSWISQLCYLISLIWLDLLSEQLQICIYHSWLDSPWLTWMK